MTNTPAITRRGKGIRRVGTLPVTSSEATGGNTNAVADEGGWASAATVEETYAHLAGDAGLEAALQRVWGQNQ